MTKTKVGVIGATGYTGEELVKILANHPQVELTYVSGKEDRSETIQDIFPYLMGKVDLPCKAFSFEEAVKKADLVFLSLPHTVSQEYAPMFLKAGKKVIDVSADYRLKDAAVYEQFYKASHADKTNLEKAVYGLPELHKDEIKKANLIANPGCYPTSVQLGLLPLLEAGVVEADGLIADCKSGVSGAGREAKLGSLFGEASDNFKAYGVAGHRHLPEIAQGLRVASGGPVDLTFVPHLVPMIRGIHATLYARLKNPDIDLQKLFELRYSGEPFVDVMPAGEQPETRSVRGGNVCRIAVHKAPDGKTAIVLSVIDNLVKGASGQALQCFNLMFDIDEAAGLSAPPLAP